MILFHTRLCLNCIRKLRMRNKVKSNYVGFAEMRKNMYQSLAELLKLAEEKRVPLYQIILDNERKLMDASEEAVWEQLRKRYEVMKASAGGALEKEGNTVGGLITGVTRRHYSYTREAYGPTSSGQGTVCGEFINMVMARALSGSEVNASMGRICAAPTAGACGILPAVLISCQEREKLSEWTVLEGLLISSGVGAVIMKNATVSGAEGGCQAECGAAAAMASAAVTYFYGGTNEMILDSAAIALKNCMGLICDPVAGLVQVPCAVRNASQAVNALLSADLVLGGMKSLIPPDEVVEAMYKVGRILPSALKETAMGGIAATPTGKRIEKEIFE